MPGIIQHSGAKETAGEKKLQAMNEEQSDLKMISEALAEATAILRGAKVAEARREAGSLLAHALKQNRTYILTHTDRTITSHDLALFRRYIARRARREPLQYITGRAEFYNLDFIVTPDVLIPRPETELAVECALEVLRANPAPLLCDVGTGSGCIIIALLNELKNARGVALDKSTRALRVAKLNAAWHDSIHRLRFVAADLFTAFDASARFDVIVSNPPYIAEKDLPALQAEVRDYEPRAALTPGRDELEIFRRLLIDAAKFLLPGGHLIFEAGWNQHEAITELIDKIFWTLLEVRRDLQGIPRTFLLRNKA